MLPAGTRKAREKTHTEHKGTLFSLNTRKPRYTYETHTEHVSTQCWWLRNPWGCTIYTRVPHPHTRGANSLCFCVFLSRAKRICSLNCTYMQVLMTYNTVAYALDMYLYVRYTIEIPIFNIVRTRNQIHHTCGAFVEFRACLGYSVEHGTHILPPCTFEVRVSALPCYFAEY